MDASSGRLGTCIYLSDISSLAQFDRIVKDSLYLSWKPSTSESEARLLSIEDEIELIYGGNSVPVTPEVRDVLVSASKEYQGRIHLLGGPADLKALQASGADDESMSAYLSLLKLGHKFGKFLALPVGLATALSAKVDADVKDTLAPQAGKFDEWLAQLNSQISGAKDVAALNASSSFGDVSMGPSRLEAILDRMKEWAPKEEPNTLIFTAKPVGCGPSVFTHNGFRVILVPSVDEKAPTNGTSHPQSMGHMELVLRSDGHTSAKGLSPDKREFQFDLLPPAHLWGAYGGSDFDEYIGRKLPDESWVKLRQSPSIHQFASPDGPQDGERATKRPRTDSENWQYFICKATEAAAEGGGLAESVVSASAVKELCTESRHSPDGMIVIPGEIEQLGLEELRERIQWAGKQLEELGDAKLYERDWQWLKNTKPSAPTFKVMQFNVLAEGLSGNPKSPTPFPARRSSAFGGFTEVPTPDVTLSWDLRRWRLVDVILDTDPDVVGLQEVDRFPDFFGPVMQKFGYAGEYCVKARSPCIDFGYYSDGLAALWKKDIFECVWYQRYQFAVGGPFLLVHLRRRDDPEMDFLFAVVHLKAKEGVVFDKTRSEQTNEILKIVGEELGRTNSKELIISGDFNTDPFIKQEEDAKVVMTPCITKVLKHVQPKLWSVYPLCTNETTAVMEKELGAGPEAAERCGGLFGNCNSDFTTWKIRGEYEIKHSIDYIFCSRAFHPVGRMLVPKGETMESHGLPGLRYPSDHLAIAAVLSWDPEGSEAEKQ